MRPGKIVKATTIEDLDKNEYKRDIRVDFHAVFPYDLYKKLENASNDTGYGRNLIVNKAVEAFLRSRKSHI